MKKVANQKIQVIKQVLPKRMFIDPKTGLVLLENPRLDLNYEFDKIKS